MFTGLIETTGTLREIRRLREGLLLGIAPGRAEYCAETGASVSISGACLTVESAAGGMLYFTAVEETLLRTTLSKARIGDTVNMERALPVTGRLEGHFVLGHVDGIGVITYLHSEGSAMRCGVRVPEKTRRFMSEKGSVAIDGISLTIAQCKEDQIEIAFIPYTIRHTTMARNRVGDEVNIECDVLARYVARCVEMPPETAREERSEGSIMGLLERSGF